MTDTGDDCGCSVSFLPMTWPSSPSYDSGEVNIRVVNFIWQSVKDSFSPSMEVHLLDEDFRTTGIGQVDDLCQLENILQFEFRTKGFDLFKKPHRNLIVIGDSVDFFTRVSEAGALGEIFESVCAVVVGNVTLSDNLLSQFASTASPGEPCVWRADSYDQLGDLKPEVEVVIDDGSCLCPGETKDQSACAGPGENCVLDEDCGLRGDCVNGVCRERPCYVPDSYDPESDINYDYYVEDYYNYYGDYNYYSGYDVGYYFEYDYHYSDGVSNRMEQRKEPLTKLSQELKSKADVRDLSSLFQGCCSRGRMLCSGVPAVCVSPDAVCDGTADCINGEDETPEACEKHILLSLGRLRWRRY
nr:uncharacterized protein LOC113800788 [Penaeus vannamei]